MGRFLYLVSWSLIRFPRRCQNQPAVEITKFVHVDLTTGEVAVVPDARWALILCYMKYLPEGTQQPRAGLFEYCLRSQVLSKGHPWREITRYDQIDE
jgi:hypothetical protein